MPKNRIKVFARFKPTNNFPNDMIKCSNNGTTITIRSKRDENSYLQNTAADFKFTVDGTLVNSTQEEAYEKVVSKMTSKALRGFNCTLLAYGQTGAGKTFTISGATENYKLRGIIPRSLSNVFTAIEEQSDKVFSIRISYMEIYNESAYDLLSTMPETGFDKKANGKNSSSTNLSFVDKPDGQVMIRGLSLHAAGNEGDALNLFFEGETNRSIAAHSLNKNSSRSHCIFTVYIESHSRSESNAKYVSSKFHLVDLAGSERINKTNSEGQTKVEALYINKSLSYLEQTVTAMAEKSRTHIPYRQTKLTHALKDSLGGKCPTTLICNVYADEAYLDETTATLRFGARMMRVPVDATLNEFFNPQAKMIELQEEIKALKLELSMQDALMNRSNSEYEPLSEHQLNDIKIQVRNFMDRKISDLDVESMRHLNAIFMQFRRVSREMEKDVSKDLRSQYILIDKSDNETVQMLQNFPTTWFVFGCNICLVFPRQFGFNFEEDAAGSDGNYVVVSGNQSPDGGRTGSKTSKNQKGASDSSKKKPRDKSTSSKAKGGGNNARPNNVPSSMSMTDTNPPTKGGRRDTIQSQDKQVDKQSPNHGTADSARREGSLASADSANFDINGEKKMPSRPSTPPGRSEAYEDFKRERGQEIARILNENKTILQSKKRMVRDLAHAVNASKHMIDGARIALERKRHERIEQGEFVDEEGELVIDEEEFELVSQLKKLKKTYRSDYNELRNAKSEVEYCEKLVKQCRERLVREFDNWYNEMFLNESEYNEDIKHGNFPQLATGGYPPGPPNLIPPAEVHIEDENEKFDRLQEGNAESREAAVFQNARLRTKRRKTLGKTYQQPQPTQPVGAPRISVRNRPPNQMSIY